MEAVEDSVGDAVEDRLLPLLAVPVGLGEAEGLEQDSLRMRLELVSATNTAPDSQTSVEINFRDKFAQAFSRENISVSYSR